MAIRIHVSEVPHKTSKSLLRRRERFIQPNVRSTIQRHCRTLKPLFRGRFTIERVSRSAVATQSTSLPAYPPSAQIQSHSGKGGYQSFEHRLGALPILDAGGMDIDHQEQTQDIDHQMAFAAADALAAIIAPDTPSFGGFHRPAVDDAGASRTVPLNAS